MALYSGFSWRMKSQIYSQFRQWFCFPSAGRSRCFPHFLSTIVNTYFTSFLLLRNTYIVEFRSSCSTLKEWHFCNEKWSLSRAEFIWIFSWTFQTTVVWNRICLQKCPHVWLCNSWQNFEWQKKTLMYVRLSLWNLANVDLESKVGITLGVLASCCA